jgi:hypothetical protein
MTVYVPFLVFICLFGTHFWIPGIGADCKEGDDVALLSTNHTRIFRTFSPGR